jgi:hypothetical protein
MGPHATKGGFARPWRDVDQIIEHQLVQERISIHNSARKSFRQRCVMRRWSSMKSSTTKPNCRCFSMPRIRQDIRKSSSRCLICSVTNSRRAYATSAISSYIALMVLARRIKSALQVQSGRYPEALEAYEWVLEHRPEFPEVWLNKGAIQRP